MSRTPLHHPRYFDSEDHEILEVVNPILGGQKSPRLLRNLFDPCLHPRGIKELAAPRPLRIACAMLDLLSSLEGESAAERLRALRSVRDEVLHNGSPSLTRNTARVLLQIMKELVRAHGDERRQLQLVHDFRQVSTGKPRLVRKLLRQYHLLEMPEDWSQMAFDHHVHDANSKGRKSPTHLIMDAWLKGIRSLGVVYYRYIRRASAAELLEAAEIMGLRVRVGVEFSAMLRGKPVYLIWAPRGFKSREDFVAFLERPEVHALMEEGKAFSAYHTRQLLGRLQVFNERYLGAINREHGLEVPPITEEAFLVHVGSGQASSLHLAEFIHATLLPHLARRVEALQVESAAGDDPQLARRLAAMDALVPDEIRERFLAPPAEASGERSAETVRGDGPMVPAERPALLNIDIPELLARLERAPRGSRVILNPSNLSADEVIEVLYLGRGKITHLEVFNVKDWAEGHTEHRETIARIRLALNSGDPLEARQLFLEVLHAVETGETPDCEERAARLRLILGDIPRFQGFYQHSHLKSRLGSDSTGRSRRSRGMGLVAVCSLPHRSRRLVRPEQRLLPVRTSALLQLTRVERWSERPAVDRLLATARRVPLLRRLGYRLERQWIPEPNSTHLATRGNIASLGGLPEHATNDLAHHLHPREAVRASAPSLRYLNTPLKNAIKVLVGFVPAFLTFYLTKEWWVLAYLGAVIWFAITGLRNVLQSVIGGGGFFRSPLLKWNDFVSWGRVADSLLFTGFSVPLLDYLVKTLFLDRGLQITAATSPILLYSVIALANGVYITSHNIFRGLPAAAAFGNFFRTVLSIPLALGLNAAIFRLLRLEGLPAAEVQGILQLWAAVISKAASDVVAGFIEGLADRGRNLSLRAVDFADKRRQMREVHSRLGMCFPEEDLLALLDHPKELVARLGEAQRPLLRQLAANALDVMYLWLLQPRGRYVFRHGIRRVPAVERLTLLAAQRVLRRKRTLTEMFVDGFLGKRYERALAFTLGRADSYLREIERLRAAFPGDKQD